LKICRLAGRIGKRRRYYLEHRDDGALFGFVVGPPSWKRFLHPLIEAVWTSRKAEYGITVATEEI
jgi:sulfhydrogenase subunit beta (sulfur reductase)